MKQISLIVLLFTAVVIAVAACKEPADSLMCGDHRLLLTISIPDGHYKPKAEIPLTFAITNTSERNTFIPITLTYARDFDKDAKTCALGSGTYIICQKQNGEFLEFKGVRVRAIGPAQLLRAGQALKAYTIDLAKWFDLKPGTYDVQLLFTKRYSGFIDAASNRLTITVK